MALTGKQSDVLSLLEQYATRTRQLANNTPTLIGLAIDRGLITKTGSGADATFALNVPIEDIRAIDAFSDYNATDLLFMFATMNGTYYQTNTGSFPDGRSFADILRKLAGNAAVE